MSLFMTAVFLVSSASPTISAPLFFRDGCEYEKQNYAHADIEIKTFLIFDFSNFNKKAKFTRSNLLLQYFKIYYYRMKTDCYII